MTAGVALVSVLGIMGAAAWMSWRTQSIIMGSQKQQIHDLAEQLPQDVAMYTATLPPEMAIEKVVEVRSLPSVSIVVTSEEGTVLAQSDSLWHSEEFLDYLPTISNLSPQPDLFQVDGNYYIGCKGPLAIDGQSLATAYVALDVTSSQQMVNKLMLSLGGVTLLLIVLIPGAIALYVRRSMQPLRQISQMTADLTVDDLDHVQFHLENAPSEVRELAQTCEVTLHRLADALAQQRQFVNDVSHELRTPLTVVSGYLQSILRRRHLLNDLQQEAIESAASEAERTIQLLQDLLTLARADSGNLQFSLIPTRLTIVLRDAIAQIQDTTSHPICLDAPEDEVYAKVDSDRLKQVLSNLVENAVRYSDPNQPVTVHLAEADNSAIIQVSDRGIGIPAEHQAQIFNRCYRVDETRTRSTGGCGLGLSIAKTLIEKMNGTIHLESIPNDGSTFTVTLPLFRENDHDTDYRSRRRRRKTRSLH
jgi:signal transduction histidine kinase